MTAEMCRPPRESSPDHQVQKAVAASFLHAAAKASRYLTSEGRSLHLVGGFVVATCFICSIYASIYARGLYHDGVAYLFRMAEFNSFILDVTPRNTVQALRQAPIILLERFTTLTLFQLGQAFTFVLLVLPPALCAICWFILPGDRKRWILFPIAYLLTGYAATATHAIGEASIATSYFWILLFLLLFRTGARASQLLFLLLCIPAFQLHEGGFLLTIILLLACAMREKRATESHERLFLALSAFLLTAIFIYQMYWIIRPQYPADRSDILNGLTELQFLFHDGHMNLPLITGSVALLALATIFHIHVTQPTHRAIWATKKVALAWTAYAVISLLATLFVEQAYTPFAQLQARYHPVFVSAGLGLVAIILQWQRMPDRAWMQSTTIYILVTLCVMQAAADINSTRRWHAYLDNLQLRLAGGNGLIPWEAMFYTGDRMIDLNWRLFAVQWTIPMNSIVFAPRGTVSAMINLPVGAKFRAVDPEKPDLLPVLRGIDYGPYKQSFSAHQSR